MAQYNNNNNNGKNNKSKYERTEALIAKIKSANSICEVLTVEEVNLPNRAAYNVAAEIKRNGNMKTNQLRKIFQLIKNTELHLNDLETTKKELYEVLPLLAYAVGRGNCPKLFFELINACINGERLKSKNDILRFIEFVTAIVAYFKFFEDRSII